VQEGQEPVGAGLQEALPGHISGKPPFETGPAGPVCSGFVMADACSLEGSQQLCLVGWLRKNI